MWPTGFGRKTRHQAGIIGPKERWCFPGMAASAIIVAGLQATSASEVVDGRNTAPTQRNSMHACPAGWFVTGVHVASNLLLCSDGFGGYQLGQEYVDGLGRPP